MEWSHIHSGSVSLPPNTSSLTLSHTDRLPHSSLDRQPVLWSTGRGTNMRRCGVGSGVWQIPLKLSPVTSTLWKLGQLVNFSRHHSVIYKVRRAMTISSGRGSWLSKVTLGSSSNTFPSPLLVTLSASNPISTCYPKYETIKHRDTD